MAPFLLLDASVLYPGVIGHPDGPSAIVLATVRLGGFAACTVENAIQETQRRLFAYFNRNKLKLSGQQAEREIKALRECPTLEIGPWITAAAELLPTSRKDAFLLEAIDLYRPTFLLTWDKALLDIDVYHDAVIATPKMLLETMAALE